MLYTYKLFTFLFIQKYIFFLILINERMLKNKFSFKNIAKLITRNYSSINPQVIASIQSIFGKNNFSISESTRQHYSKDESLHQLVARFTSKQNLIS